MQSFQDADIQKKYWQSKFYDERLSATMEMIKVAYNQETTTMTMSKPLTEIRLRNG